MKIEPIGDQILIQRDDEERVSKSGLVLPDTAVKRARSGVVVATGDGIRIGSAVASHILSKGDRVWFNMLSGNEFVVEGEKVLLMIEREVIVMQPSESNFDRILSPEPMDDRVMIRPDEIPAVTEGGIALPEIALKRDEVMTGTIVAVGPGRRYWDFEKRDILRTPSSLMAGDRVYYARYTGSDVTLNGVEYRVVRESDVLCSVENSDG